MISRRMLAAALFALAPAAALAFEIVDTLPFPSRGGFSEAYPRDAIYPTLLWAQAGLIVHSNPFGLADDASPPAFLGEEERSDAILRYGIGVIHTARVIGRQSVRLHARGEYYDYLRFNQLDHFAYDVGGDLLWEVGNDLSGTLGYERTKGLADLREVQRPARDDVTTDLAFATAAYRFHPDWRVRAGATGTRAVRSGTRGEIDSTAATVRGGIDYVTGLANAIGVEARHTQGDAPVTALLDPTGTLRNKYTEDEVAGVLTYNLGAQLLVGGRLGRTKREYEELPVEPFEGTTGRARVDWRPGAKVGFVFEIFKEPQALLDVDASHVVVRSTSFGPRWAPTMKLVFHARFVNERRQYQSTAASTLPARDDTLRVMSLGGGWEPQRHITIGAGIEYGERRSNTLGRDYEYYAGMANLRYDW